eukprot:CAMPEP_0177624212 /NCGR_PEP_ID=MMETSP0419_2-20121207/29360_1 /TAXON_ID=582737 /ORGANISM="Tetraselmis sp., Strain GSL018" /LENGTH=150 /DNA_ID=CAMNT_0019124905 /DNA_START=545 /DNA_END=1000 /DNA_ORIENTATION=-
MAEVEAARSAASTGPPSSSQQDASPSRLQSPVAGRGQDSAQTPSQGGAPTQRLSAGKRKLPPSWSAPGKGSSQSPAAAAATAKTAVASAKGARAASLKPSPAEGSRSRERTTPPRGWGVSSAEVLGLSDEALVASCRRILESATSGLLHK